MTERRLHEKHATYRPYVKRMGEVAAEVGEVPIHTLERDAGDLHEFLAHVLIPHAIGEGRIVFPVIRRVTGTAEGTRAMRGEHVEIARLTDELEAIRRELEAEGISASRKRALRHLLGDLREMVDRHFREEEELCLALVEAELSPEECRTMYEAMETAAREIREAYE